MKPLLITLLLLSCDKGDTKPPNPNGRLIELIEKRKEILEDLPWTNWPTPEDCDGALWAGQAKAGGSNVTKLSLAYEGGKPFRRPSHDCFIDGKDNGSKSTTSNDMSLGLLWGLWYDRDVTQIRKVVDYGENNNWVMGEPFPEQTSRVLMSYNLRILYSKALHLFTNGQFENFFFDKEPKLARQDSDYQAHLSSMIILLYEDMQRAHGFTLVAPIAWIDIARHHVKKFPDAAIHKAAVGLYTGDLSDAIDQLLDDDKAPSFVRGKEVEKIAVAHWLFVATRIIDIFGG